jgi:hypothetical protein
MYNDGQQKTRMCGLGAAEYLIALGADTHLIRVAAKDTQDFFRCSCSCLATKSGLEYAKKHN